MAYRLPTSGRGSDIFERGCPNGSCDGVDVVGILRLRQHRRDKFSSSEAVGEPQARERIALAERSQKQHIGIGGDHRGCRMSDLGIDKVDIGFVDEQHAAEGQRQLMELGCRGKRA